MLFKKHNLTVFTLTIAIFLLVLTACGGSETESETAATSVATEAPAPTEPSQIQDEQEETIAEAVYVDLSPYVIAIDFLDEFQDEGSTVYITLNPDSAQLPEDKLPRADNFFITASDPIPIDLVGKVEGASFDGPTLSVRTQTEFPEGAMLQILAGEIEIREADGSINAGPFFLELSSDIAGLTTARETDATDSSADDESNAATSTASDEITTTVSGAGDLPLYPVLKGGKWGFIDKAGQMVIEPQFDDIHNFSFPTFSEGLEPVKVGEKWGYINPQGEFVMEPQYGYGLQFTNGIANFVIADKTGYTC